MRPLLSALPLSATLFVATIASAQNCYYPNGDISTTDGACNSDGGACCPYQWECLSNGLCHLDNQNFFGRYTCTDQTWQSSDCPQICTQGNTAPGDEALLQCSDGSWCCDGDRSFNCCTTANTDYFQLPQGNSVAYISSLESPTSVASMASGNSAASTSVPTSSTTSQQQTSSSSDPGSTSSAASSTAAESASSSQSQARSSSRGSSDSSSQASQARSTASSTMTSRAVTTNTDGSVSTIVLISTISAASVPTNQAATDPSHKSSSHLGLIIGLAVGIPVVLLACAILAALLWKHRKSKRASSSTSEDQPVMDDKFGYQVGHVAPDGRAPEIDSYPVAGGRTKSGRKSELEGSFHYHSPTVSTGTAGTGQPPGYSPTTPAMNTVSEEPAELWGGYVPYRPPRAELPDRRTS